MRFERMQEKSELLPAYAQAPARLAKVTRLQRAPPRRPCNRCNSFNEIT